MFKNRLSFITKFSLLLLLCVGLVMVIGMWPAPKVSAALPPRPVPTATATRSNYPTAGASIQLHAINAPVAAWTVVQWQDAIGAWHEVTGWQGTLAEDGVQTWWVGSADFGTGPFRWVVYSGYHAKWLAASAAFNLPARDHTSVQLEVTLTP